MLMGNYCPDFFASAYGNIRLPLEGGGFCEVKDGAVKKQPKRNPRFE